MYQREANLGLCTVLTSPFLIGLAPKAEPRTTTESPFILPFTQLQILRKEGPQIVAVRSNPHVS